jgi:hypothetical protein
VWVTLIICLFVAMPGFAGVIVYNNGAGSTNSTAVNDLVSFPISGVGAWTSDTFTIANSGTVLIAVDAAIWSLTGNLGSSLNYCISTSVDCSGSIETGTGVSLTADGALGTSGTGYTLEEYTFALKSNAYSSGTYWLTLTNAVVGNGNTAYWDEYGGTTGTSTARSSLVELPTNQSQSFDIQAAAPEPGSIALFGSGLMLLLAGFARRARR